MLSGDGALHIWSMNSVSKGAFELLPEAGAEVMLMDGVECMLDVLDLDVGDNHIAVLHEGGELLVIGDIRSG